MLQLPGSKSQGAAPAGAGEPGASKSKARKEQQQLLQRALHDRAMAATRHPVGFSLLAAAGMYATAWGTIEVFHRTRRRFLRALLLELGPALDSLGQTWWADFGCLLGIHRGGDLILHDNDIDLVVLNPDWPALLAGLRARLPPKYSLKGATVGQPQSSWIRVYCPLGMADLFGAYYDEGQHEVYVDCGHGDTMHINTSLVLPASRKPWRGYNLSVPANVEGTLGVRYGPNWRTPAYMEKGADTVEGSKPYAKLFKALARLGIRI